MLKHTFKKGSSPFRWVALLLMMLNVVPMYAQRKISGRVIDEKGEVMIGVNILVAGSSVGVITDIEGNFSLNAREGDVLHVSSIGYTTQNVKVGSQSSIQIILVEDTKTLDEVVVVGYGTMKKRDLTGSVKSVSNETLKNSGQTSTLGALRGQNAGVSVTQATGKLGTGYNIEIRGMNSINKSSAPLCVVDGVVGGDINALNPADIEKIDVLKDVSATAIYGSRGANGVVIVTTKSGKSGRNVVTYDGTVGFTTPTNLPEMFNGDDYVAYAKEAIRGGSNHNPFTGFEKENADHRNYTDWLDYTLQNGFQTSHTLGMTGGNEKEKHVFSVGYTKQTGNIEGEQLQRFNAKLGIEGKAGNFTLGMSAYARYTDLDNGSKEALRSAFRLRPIAQPTDANGNDQFFVQDYRPDRFTNPRFDSRNENTNYRQMNLFTNFFVDYKLIEGVNIRSSVSPYLYSERIGYSADTFTKTNKGTALPKADLSNNNGYSYTWDNTVTYSHLFNKKHQFNAMLGTSTFQSVGEHSALWVKDLPYNYKWHNLGAAGTEEKRESSEWKESLVSFMGRFNYTYKDKYLFTATGRADGSSKLAAGNQWGFFPSAAVAWRITGEDFLKDHRWVDDLKLRVSYGESGNNVVDAYSTLLQTSNTEYDFGGVNANGQYLNRIPNYNLGWEKSKEVNVGLDFSFFKNRLNGSVDFYNKNNVDLIMGQGIPQTNGFEKVDAVNIGATRNTGLEIALNTLNIQTKNFSWSTTLSFATNKNQITEIFGDSRDHPDQALFIGQPVKVLYDYDWKGIWQENEREEAAKYGKLPGAVKEVDQNEDDRMSPTDDRVILGSPFPDWTGSMTNTFNYKNWDLSVFIYTRQGEKKFSKFHRELQSEYLGEINQLKVNYWTPENPSNEFYRPGFNGGNINLLLYKDFSFVRVGHITLGYNLPEKWMKSAHMTRARIYVTSVNPFVFTKYTGLDPEFGGYSTDATNSDDSASYNSGVSVTTYMVGVNVTF